VEQSVIDRFGIISRGGGDPGRGLRLGRERAPHSRERFQHSGGGFLPGFHAGLVIRIDIHERTVEADCTIIKGNESAEDSIFSKKSSPQRIRLMSMEKPSASCRR
jgi:hypothetical protein